MLRQREVRPLIVLALLLGVLGGLFLGKRVNNRDSASTHEVDNGSTEVLIQSDGTRAPVDEPEEITPSADAPYVPDLEELVETYREEHIAYTDGVGNPYDVTFNLMRFTVDSPDAEKCNAEIAQYAEAKIDEELSNAASGLSMTTSEVSSDAWITNDTVTLIIHLASMWDDTDTIVFSLDIYSGELLSEAEVAARAGVSEDEMWARAEDAARKEFHEINGIGMIGRDYSFYKEILTNTVSEKNIHDMNVFVDRDGILMASGTIFTMAGSCRQNAVFPLLPVEPSADLTDVFAAYRKVLPDLLSNAGGDSSFKLIYFDADDIPELVISEGTYHACGVSIYRYDQSTDAVMCICDRIGTNGDIEYYPHAGVAFSTYIGMGYYVAQFYYFDGATCTAFAKHEAELNISDDTWMNHEFSVNESGTDRESYQAAVEARNGNRELNWDEDGLEALGYRYTAFINPEYGTYRLGEVSLDEVFDVALY